MLRRRISLLLIFISITFIFRMCIYAPWRFNPSEFLFQPLLFLATPILLVGCMLWFRPHAVWPPMPIPLIVLVIGFLGVIFQGGWPAPNLSTTWEDSIQTLGILQACFILVSGPFYLCCFLSVVTGFAAQSGQG